MNNIDIDLIELRIQRFIKLYEFLKMDLEMTELLSKRYEKKFIDEALPEDLTNIEHLDKLDKNDNIFSNKGGCNKKGKGSGMKLDKMNLKKEESKDTEENKEYERLDREFEKELNELSNSDNVKNKMIKKVYHQISKVSHPDKCKDKLRNKMFIDAKEFYENEILIGLLYICSKLKINVKFENISNDEFTIIYRNIKEVESNIKKCKDTVSWKWSNTNNNDEKKNIKSWIKTKINNHFLINKKYKIDNIYPIKKYINVEGNISTMILSYLYPECILCSEQYRHKSKISIIKRCNHDYHESCLNKWIDRKNKYKCPLCINEF